MQYFVFLPSLISCISSSYATTSVVPVTDICLHLLHAAFNYKYSVQQDDCSFIKQKPDHQYKDHLTDAIQKF